jgi:hypothetical protein
MEWKNVLEEMPTQGNDVIGWFSLDGEYVAGCVWFDCQSGWLVSSKPYSEQKERLIVTHWMPLPEPPNP